MTLDRMSVCLFSNKIYKPDKITFIFIWNQRKIFLHETLGATCHRLPTMPKIQENRYCGREENNASKYTFRLGALVSMLGASTIMAPMETCILYGYVATVAIFFSCHNGESSNHLYYKCNTYETGAVFGSRSSSPMGIKLSKQ
jgi:hypothetical protein